MSKPLPVNTFKKGRYRGQVVDNRTRRSIELVEEDADFYIVDYFFHRSQFYTAKIPKNAVKYIQLRLYCLDFELSRIAFEVLIRAIDHQNPISKSTSP